MGIKLCSNFGFHIVFCWLVGLELRITTFADAERYWSAFYDPKIVPEHVHSLAHLVGRA